MPVPDYSEPDPPELPERSAVDRRRLCWLLLGLLPALAAVLCFWVAVRGGDPDGSIGSLYVFAAPAWILFCAIKMACLCRSKHPAAVFGLTLLHFVVLILMAAVLGLVLLWGSCMVIDIDRSNWHPDPRPPRPNTGQGN